MNNSSNNTGSPGYCTNAACVAQGYDCCVQGQCVTEEQVKDAGKNADLPGLNLAELESSVIIFLVLPVERTSLSMASLGCSRVKPGPNCSSTLAERTNHKFSTPS